MLKLLFLSTTVGPLGSGLGGGVELTLTILAQEMQQRGHKVTVIAPMDSVVEGVEVIGIKGAWQVPAQTQTRDMPITMPGDPLLGHMWEYARKVATEYDLLVNFAFDWLPLYLTSFFSRPIAHFISMGSLSDALDKVMAQTVEMFPETLGVYTRAQADSFSFPCRILGSGIDLSLYEYVPVAGNTLAWLGRIAPEKALQDAVAAAHITGIPLRIFGKIQDSDYWQQILESYPTAPIEYCGFLSTKALQKQLGQARALLMTPRWLEAFGNVAIEALACGVPVIAYNRGGPTEIVRHGLTGFLVEPDSVTGLVEAIGNIDKIDRALCRQQAESEYSVHTFGNKFEQWFRDILQLTKT